MRIFRLTVLLALIAIVFGSCKSEVHERVSVPEQLKMVPSDALVIINNSRCSDCLAHLDSSHIFRKLDTGLLSGSKATLSFCYTNELSPILAIEVDKALRDTSDCLTRLLEQTGELGLKTRIFEPVEGYTKKTNIVITTTETMMSVISRHQDGHLSILDAADFQRALALTAGSDNWVMIRNSGASKLIPKNFLDGLFTQRDLVALARTFADWTCISDKSGGKFSIKARRDESGTYFIDHLDAMEPMVSRLPAIIPDSTDFVIDIPMNVKAYRESYEKYLDAQLKLEKYNSTISSLRKSSGKDPRKWEEELDTQELALIKWLGHSVIALRPAEDAAASGPQPNPFAGFVPALYGSAFKLDDDSYTAHMQGWHIIGSEADIAAFMGATRPEDFSWPVRKLKYIIDTPELHIYSVSDNIELELKKYNDTL